MKKKIVLSWPIGFSSNKFTSLKVFMCPEELLWKNFFSFRLVFTAAIFIRYYSDSFDNFLFFFFFSLASTWLKCTFIYIVQLHPRHTFDIHKQKHPVFVSASAPKTQQSLLLSLFFFFDRKIKFSNWTPSDVCVRVCMCMESIWECHMQKLLVFVFAITLRHTQTIDKFSNRMQTVYRWGRMRGYTNSFEQKT